MDGSVSGAGRPSIELLPVEVSRRIAAGEVIEKPASVVRELIDNSLDAGASEIDLTWEEGGSELIRIRDNGMGMTTRDLDLCWKPHATSKIRTLEDLDHSRSLGFRGEALASIAAVSELTIESTVPGADAGNRLEVRQARLLGISPAPPRPGTSVTVQRLFANLPARRRFLSPAAAETRTMRNTILEKALPFPGVRFTMPGAGNSVRVLPVQTLPERVAEVFGSVCPLQSLTELHGSGEGFSCTILAAHPEVIRRDRRYIWIYVNGRRVTEYKLVQAVEYAYQDVQHGGVFPAAAVLIDVDPELADFNIHPAKREVRLRTMGEIHHRIVEILRAHLHAWAVRAARWEPARRERELWEAHERAQPGNPRETAAPRRPGIGHISHRGQAPSFEHTRRAVPPPASASPSTPEQILLHGTAFGTYILAEKGDRLFIIDQHALHERLLYDRLAADRTPQPLLIPEEFETTEDQDRALEAHREEYRQLGLTLEQARPGQWRLTAIPGEYRHRIEDILETIRDLGGLQEQFDRAVLAEIACKAAIKAGDHLDGVTGSELVRRAFALPEPRCPHGRPLWVELDRDQLERLIGRR